MAKSLIGLPVPPLAVCEWVQGEACSFETLQGQVVLVVVFQVNCPGCFLYSLPQALDLHQRYAGQGLAVLGVATAFEDFDKNTLANLRLLLETGQVIGETRRMLHEYGQLQDERWPYRIPFPVAMDCLQPAEHPVTEQAVDDFIREKLPDVSRQSADYQRQIRLRVRDYLQTLEYRPETFERFALQGTPSYIVVDKRGVLRACRFGEFSELESLIRQLLAE